MIEENNTKEQTEINGGKKNFIKLTLFFSENLTCLGIFLNMPELFILIFDDSFNWSKQFMISDSNELPIFKINGCTSGLELLRTILCT